MKNLWYMLFLGLLIYSCAATEETRQLGNDPAANRADTVRIANDSLEYEIIVTDPGFFYFLQTVARPEGYHSLSYLENKNRFLVPEYNQRVNQPQLFNPSIYEMEINYNTRTEYGYEVNYKLYNYFVFLTQKHNQRFSIPTRP